METDETQGAWSSLVLLERLRAGDEQAAEAVYCRYFKRLTLLARSRLSSRLARRTDPEDIVMSVYRSFFVKAQEGRFVLSRGGDLWRLLASITKHKLLHQARRELAGRRSIDAELPLGQVDEARILRRENEPTPEDAIALADELEHIFSSLDALGRRVLELRLQAAQLSEIAKDTGRSERTIRRTLAQIRELMAKRLEAEFFSRFPARHEQLRTELLRIDREIDEELAGSRSSGIVSPAAKACTADDSFEQTNSIPIFSHQDILLKRMIGAGKMGKVYQAWDHNIRCEIAVKFLRKGLLHEPALVQRFIGEAITIAKLHHPNIVGIHGLGRTPSGAYFIVMDLVTGPNLDVLARANTVSVEEVIPWAMELCDALEHAHAQGIVHCDLKPANLLLDEHGRLRVTDFGLARSLTEHTAWAAEVEGTAPFMAPEQVSRYWGPIDIRTDVYGVGAVLYTLLTGRPPWAGRRLPDILAKVVSAAPVIPPASLRPDLPQAMSDLCRKCLSKAPEDRYHNVQEVRLVLGRLKGG